MHSTWGSWPAEKGQRCLAPRSLLRCPSLGQTGIVVRGRGGREFTRREEADRQRGDGRAGPALPLSLLRAGSKGGQAPEGTLPLTLPYPLEGEPARSAARLLDMPLAAVQRRLSQYGSWVRQLGET
jgi:hypothetical protein